MSRRPPPRSAETVLSLRGHERATTTAPCLTRFTEPCSKTTSLGVNTGSAAEMSTEWTPPEDRGWGRDFRGRVSESHLCVDCGFDTAPGLSDRAECEAIVAKMGPLWDAGYPMPAETIDSRSEVYIVRNAVWTAAGMAPWGGCLCIGCLEKRIGRRLKPKDFPRDHPFNQMPGTPRLLDRRGYRR